MPAFRVFTPPTNKCDIFVLIFRLFTEINKQTILRIFYFSKTFHDQIHNTILLLIQKGQYIRYCLFMKFQKTMSKIRCCLFIKTNTKIKKSDAKFILFFKRQVLTFSGIPSYYLDQSGWLK